MLRLAVNIPAERYPKLVDELETSLGLGISGREILAFVLTKDRDELFGSLEGLVERLWEGHAATL